MLTTAHQSEPLTTTKETALHVLRYWHQLEFFVPYNLDGDLSYGSIPLDMNLQQLTGERADQVLPWLRDDSGLFHYHLYLLPFDKKELTALSTRHFPLEFKQQETVALEEKLDDEGLTCLARLFIDKDGCPQWSGLSVSTLPWAMGLLQANEEAHLSDIAYDKDMILLKSALSLLERHHEATQSEQYPKGRFTATILLQLLTVLCQWARYSPDYPIVVKIKAIPAKQTADCTKDPYLLPSNLPATVAQDSGLDEEIAADDTEGLSILNSFFIQDLEKSLNHLANKDHDLLEAYINGCQEKKDILLFENQSLLLRQLSPSQTNLGRWPAAPSNHMSLMQQLCINQCFHPLSTQPLLATNGPPGTGKTTLMQDIIAENIVQRARVLADFLTVSDCFGDKKQIAMGEQNVTLSILKPALTGFEMLVVSSNNNAVENITRELPLKSKLAPAYSESCQYLRPIAAKLAAKHYKQRVVDLKPALKPWGLIAVALGNTANRQEFIERFFFSPNQKNITNERVQRGEYLTIWEWRDTYKGIRFNDAKTAFLKTYALVEEYQNKLDVFADLHAAVLENKWAQAIKDQEALIATYEQTIAALTHQKEENEALLKEIECHQDTIYNEIHHHVQFKPALWRRFFRTNEAKTFQDILQQLQARRQELTKTVLQVQAAILDNEKALALEKAACVKALEQIKHDQQAAQTLQEAYQQCQTHFEHMNLPGSRITETDQISGYWQAEKWNDLRSQLFVDALQLHQAWLAEALQKKYFGGNLFAIHRLLDGKHPLKPSDELIIWQSLFMMIPVVSSTFASIGKQFKNIAAQSFGWLLIDEAGQALPQAAVGALFRCKKAIVVGDPRQIEPIMTLPPHLIEGVAKYHFKTINPYWLPHMTSIQRLADLASPIGSTMQQNQQPEWIGIPLLVHRRCLEPMFSVANEIAYDNKMINARTASNINLPISTWFDVTGVATDKQYVPAQGSCLLDLFIWFYNHDHGLPHLFIITPFKQIRKNLKQLLQHQEDWQAKINPALPIPTKQELTHWLNRHIGTVHTFQGKESEKVIFVLGADKTQKGAIRWASSKPNLLNVALTRATDRIYIIGDWDLWATKRYFCRASAVLERKIWTPSS